MDVKEKAKSSAEEDPRPGAVDAPAEEQGAKRPNEHGGPKGLEPTRYGDWERNGRCYDF